LPPPSRRLARLYGSGEFIPRSRFNPLSALGNGILRARFKMLLMLGNGLADIISKPQNERTE
jgi:hypothetical protein